MGSSMVKSEAVAAVKEYRRLQQLYGCREIHGFEFRPIGDDEYTIRIGQSLFHCGADGYFLRKQTCCQLRLNRIIGLNAGAFLN
ncbi:hypothetical protein D3C75_1179850 [compost metagenome]